MNDSKDLQEYEAYISNLTVRELDEVASSLDKNKYPERYEILKSIRLEAIEAEKKNSNYLETYQSPKIVEPFNLFGERSIIYSKEEAKKILKDNSYYFFVLSLIPLCTFLFMSIKGFDIGLPKIYVLALGIFYFSLGIAIRKFQSRIASVIAFITFCWIIIIRVIDSDMGGFFFMTFIFAGAAYRSIKASFYFHKH